MKISTAQVKKLQKNYGLILWHEGMDEQKLKTTIPILYSHFKQKQYYYWPKGKSYIFTLIYGGYCISKQTFDSFVSRFLNVSTSA